MQDLALALHRLVPVPHYSGSLTDNTRESYDQIIWRDQRPKPCYEDVLQVDLSKPPPEELKKLAAGLRYWRLVGGFSYQGHTFNSDERAQAAMALAAAAGPGVTRWKTADGKFVDIDPMELACAYTHFASRLYEAEAGIVQGIDAGITTTEQQVRYAIEQVDNGITTKTEEKANGRGAHHQDYFDAAGGGFQD